MNMKVLLVDDEPFILQGLSVLIDWRAEGFEIVKTASNGKEALDYLKENQVDLIIADIPAYTIRMTENLYRIPRNNNQFRS